MFWSTDERACDVRITVWSSPRAQVSYPAGKPYATFSHGSTLDRSQRDYSTFRVTAVYDQGIWVIMAGTVYWSDCGPHGATHTKQVGFLLPVTR